MAEVGITNDLIRYAQRPESHEVIMLDEWIKAVGEEDQILHMGDVFLGKQGNPERWARVISRLPGQKFLIKGNHDKANARLYVLAGFTIVSEFITKGFGFSHRPMTAEFPGPSGDWHTNIHGHTHSNEYNPEHDGTRYEGKTYINVCVEHTNLKPVRLGNIWSAA